MYDCQAESTMEFVRKQAIDENPFKNTFVTKLRTAPWSFDAILTKAKEIRATEKRPGVQKLPRLLAAWQGNGFDGVSSASPGLGAGKSADAEDSRDAANRNAVDTSSDEEEKDEEDEDEDDVTDSGKTQVGSMLNAKAVTESMVAGCVKRMALSAAGSPLHSSPGAKMLRTMNDANGVPLREVDRQDLVDRRIRSADISRILRGERLGREIRWCRDTADAFRMSAMTALEDQLTHHRVLCEQAEF